MRSLLVLDEEICLNIFIIIPDVIKISPTRGHC
jgi:hypothetical protein